MKVKVRPINVNGRIEFKKQRERREVYAGNLRVFEDRMHKVGRVVTVARVVSTVDSAESTLLEMYDATLLWAEGGQMRLRGFEEVGDVEYGQTWDVEVL